MAATTEETELKQLRRERDIREVGRLYKERGYDVSEERMRRAIESGTDSNAFARQLLDSDATPTRGADTRVLDEMNRSSKREFSLCRALSGAISREGVTGYEAEVMEEHVHRTGQQLAPDSIVIPFEALNRRSMLAGDYGAGGSTVPVDTGALIPKLDPQPVVEAAGGTFLRGLTAPTALPRHTTAAIAEWVAEAQEVSKSTPGTDDVLLTPHGLAAYCETSKQLVITSSIDVEAFLRNELTRRINLGLDKAALVGAGTSGVPRGLFSIAESAINPITFGGAPSWSKLVEFGGEIEDQDGAASRMSWVTSASVKSKWQATSKDTGSGMFLAEGDMANGHRIHVTSQLRGTSAEDRVLFGDFSQLVVSIFGGLEILVDQSSSLHRRGLVGLTALVHADVVIRQGKAFARSTDKGNQVT